MIVMKNEIDKIKETTLSFFLLMNNFIIVFKVKIMIIKKLTVQILYVHLKLFLSLPLIKGILLFLEYSEVLSREMFEMICIFAQRFRKILL